MLVNSTRIRVARNVKDVPLGPGISKQERKDLFDKISNSLKEMKDDLKGQAYPLQGMKPDV